MLKHFIKEFQTNSQLPTIHAIELVATVNPANSCFTFTMDKTHPGLVIAPFYVQILKGLLAFFSYVG